MLVINVLGQNFTKWVSVSLTWESFLCLRHFESVSQYRTRLRSVLQQGSSEPVVYGDQLYKLGKNSLVKQNFLINLRKLSGDTNGWPKIKM